MHSMAVDVRPHRPHPSPGTPRAELQKRWSVTWAAVGVVEVSNLAYSIPGGRVLFEDPAFRVGDGAHVALIGANGAGKTTLLKLIAGHDKAKAGFVHVDGHIGLMRQFIGTLGAATTVRDFCRRGGGRAARLRGGAPSYNLTVQQPDLGEQQPPFISGWVSIARARPSSPVIKVAPSRSAKAM